MSKKVIWPEGKFGSAARRPGTYTSLAERFEKAESQDREQRSAQEYLQKAMFPMIKLLELRMQKAMPLIVMRPLRYQTSGLNTQDDDNDGFYNVSKSQGANANFVDKVVTIMPGTQLVLKSLDPSMQEFIFVDGEGKEHPISYSQRDALLTQTDIFEVTRQYLEENKGE